MTQTRQPTANKYGGKCSQCGQRVEAGAGILGPRSVETGKYTVRHLPRRTVAPTGPWDRFDAYETDGCPEPPPAPVVEYVTYRITREFVGGAFDGYLFTGDIYQTRSEPEPFKFAVGDTLKDDAITGPACVIRNIEVIPGIADAV
jgi:hypothetical protein